MVLNGGATSRAALCFGGLVIEKKSGEAILKACPASQLHQSYFVPERVQLSLIQGRNRHHLVEWSKPTSTGNIRSVVKPPFVSHP